MQERRKEVARRLRVAREMAGLSQEQAADHLGLSRPAVTEIEAGRRRVAAEELAALADLYGVRTGWLLSESAEALNADSLQVAARALRDIDPADLDVIVQLVEAVAEANRDAQS